MFAVDTLAVTVVLVVCVLVMIVMAIAQELVVATVRHGRV
jgi:hypothetical protein